MAASEETTLEKHMRWLLHVCWPTSKQDHAATIHCQLTKESLVCQPIFFLGILCCVGKFIGNLIVRGWEWCLLWEEHATRLNIDTTVR